MGWSLYYRMKKIFIAFADEKMAYSLKRIGRQAKGLGIFDEVLLYSPKDLPGYLLQSPLMQHSYGGGYWAWKPCIIWETLQKYEDGTAVCYIDAGCSLNMNMEEWNMYFGAIENTDTLLFQYPDEMPSWEHYGTSSTKIMHWTKKTALDYYDDVAGEVQWREHNKILGGFVFARGKKNPIIKEWLDTVLHHPEVIDDSGVFDEQYPFFVRHKHDQPCLTALACKYPGHCTVFPELLDEGPSDAAVVAERVRLRNYGDYLLWRMKKVLKEVVGQRLVTKIKSLFRK